MRLLLCILVASIHFPALAQLGGEQAYSFLNLSSNARIGALGGNLISVVDDDINLSYANPSLLNKEQHGALALNYTNYFSDAGYGFFSYGHHIDSLATFSGTIQFNDYGEFTETNVNGEEIGSFSASDYVFNIGAGKALDSNFSVGANVKFIYSQLADYNSSAVATDLAGTYYNPEKKISAALVIKNVGIAVDAYRDGNSEDLPFEIQVGVSKRLQHSPFRFSLTATNLQKWDLTYQDPRELNQIDPLTGELIQPEDPGFADMLMRHITLGSEMIFGEHVFFRFGYNYKRRQELKLDDFPGTAGLSWGLGFRINKFHLSYGGANYGHAAAGNHFSLTTRLSDFTRSSN